MNIIEEHIKLLFENNPLPMFFYDCETLKILDANTAALEKYGYMRNEFLNLTIKDIRPPEDVQALLENIAKSHEKFQNAGIWRHCKKDGSIFYVEITSHEITFESRKARFVLATDVTDRQKAELARQYVEKQFRTVVEHPLIGFYIIRDNRFFYVNPTYAEIFGYTSEEICSSDSVLDFVHESDRNLVQENIRKRLSGEVESLRYIFRGKRKDGPVISVEVYGSLTELDGEKVIIGTLLDITEKLKSESALQYRYEIEKIISQISSCFVNLGYEETDAGILYALKTIGEFVKVDRSYIFLISDDKKKMDNTQEWCAPGIESYIDVLKNLSLDTYSWSINKLQNFEVINLLNISNLPPAAAAEKKIFQMQSIKSLINVPLIYERNFIGILGFDSVRTEKSWTEEDITILKLVGEIIVNALRKKKANEELIKLSAVVKQSADSVIITDKNDIIEFVNPAFETTSGFKREEVIGKSPAILRSGKHDQDFYRQLWSSISCGKSVRAKFVDKKKNGELFYQETTINPISDTNGNIRYIVSTGRDITERKKIEEVRERLTAILEATPDFVSTADMDFKILYINNAGQKMIGLPDSGEIANLSISDVHPAWANQIIMRDAIPRTLQYGFWEGETALLHREGFEIPVSQVILAHKGSNGEVFYLSTIMRDISEHKLAEEKLKESEQRYRSLVETSPDSITLIDLSGKVLFCNEKAAVLHGFTVAEVIGQNFFDFIALEDRSRAAVNLQSTLLTGKNNGIEYTFMKKDSTCFLGELNTSVITDTKGEPKAIIGITRDITERKKNEEEISKAYELLQQKVEELEISKRAISRLLTDVTEKKNENENLLGNLRKRQQQLEKLAKDLVQAEEIERRKFSRELHDSLGQILTSLKINMELAVSSAKSLDDKTYEYINESFLLADEAIKEAKQLSYDLRPSVLDDFGLNAAIRMLVTQIQRRTNIAIELNLDTEEVRYDAILETVLYRIVQEAFTNIVKHSQASVANIQLIRRGNIMALSISDNGKGFDEAEVFKNKDDELHFGLRNIRERVEILGGKLYIDSIKGKGTEIIAEIELNG